MSTIWGHVESVVYQSKSSPSLVLTRRSTFWTCSTECIVGMGIRILKSFESVSVVQAIRDSDHYGACRLAGARKDRGYRVSTRFGDGSW